MQGQGQGQGPSLQGPGLNSLRHSTGVGQTDRETDR